jgi:hypothetical protein
VALLLATMQTPWRFRTKRHLWAYAGLAVVTHASADHERQHGRPVRRRRAPLTRGLNPNHNRVLKDVFTGTAPAATARPGPLQEFYHGMLARGMREELARVTLTRKLAALTLRLWQKGERFDPTQLTQQAHEGAGGRGWCGTVPRQRLPMPRATVRGAVSSRSSARPQSAEALASLEAPSPDPTKRQAGHGPSLR